jgi:hypothetical protein
MNYPKNPTRDGVTPGQWGFACDSYGKVWRSKMAAVTSHDPKFNGHGFVRVASRIENWGDARLIAAAPELLAACKESLARLDGMTTEEFSNGGDRAVRGLLAAAIAKAEGRAT